jgi:predicted MFS family arabinose efflux permease
MLGENLQTKVKLNKFLILTMAIASGIAVANLYYIQPLLAEMARSFNITQVHIGIAATLTQIGYALGMFIILPLADIREKKSLIIFMLGCSACALLLTALSVNSIMLCTASFVVGFTSISPQLLVPLAAQLAEPEERGRIIGIVMSGLLVGILVSRSFSGLIGQYFGWQCVYFIAAALMITLAVYLMLVLPRCLSDSKIRYYKLFQSMFSLTRELPILREAALNGGLMFAAFSAFWTTLSFLLSSPHYHLGADAAGLFGLVGVVGAMAAPIAGRIADKRSPRLTISISIGIVTLSYICFFMFGFKLFGVIAGVILLDLGIQACQITNQARIHAISNEARNRINTVYMVTYFLGGSLGTFLGSYCYAHFGWHGVCILGVATQIAAASVHIKGYMTRGNYTYSKKND